MIRQQSGTQSQLDADAPTLPVSYRVEHACEFDHGLVEVRRYLWARPVEQAFQGTADALVLNMALTSRPARTRVERIEGRSILPARDAGRLLVMMPGAHYRLYAPTGAFRSLHCALACSKFEGIIGETIDWASLGELGGVLRPGTDIELLLSRIGRELSHEQIGRKAAIDAYANALCVELARRFRQGRPSRPDVFTGGLAPWRMRVLTERVHADMPAPRLAELSRLCGLTTRQLSRAFKAETGITIARYVDEVTMDRAHRMLTSSNLAISSIASQLGFASADSFAQSYRRMTGVAPSRARRQ